MGLLISLLLLVAIATGGTAIVPRDCYDDWNALKQHIEQGSHNTATATTTTTTTSTAMGSNLVKICPGAFLSLDEKQEDHWMYMTNVKNLTLQCGDHGRGEDDCVMDGGWHHLWIEEAQRILIRGITFQRARYGSIWHADVQQVKYENCLWRDNQHVLVYESFSNGGGAAINGYNADLFFANSTFLVRTTTRGRASEYDF